MKYNDFTKIITKYKENVTINEINNWKSWNYFSSVFIMYLRDFGITGCILIKIIKIFYLKSHLTNMLTCHLHSAEFGKILRFNSIFSND